MGITQNVLGQRRAHPKSWLLKKVLASALVVGGLSTFTIAGTYATFTNETSNRNATISSGTLVLSNLVGASTTCFSYSAAANSNSSCNALVTNATLGYPGVPVTANVTISNGGSIAASSVALYMPHCNTDGTGATVLTTSPSAGALAGGGNPCASGGLMMTIDESNSTFSTKSCVFPTITAGTACTPAANTLAFMAGKKDTSHLYSLNEGLSVAQTRYYIVTLELPLTASNTLQGEEAVFDLTWLASQ